MVNLNIGDQTGTCGSQELRGNPLLEAHNAKLEKALFGALAPSLAQYQAMGKVLGIEKGSPQEQAAHILGFLNDVANNPERSVSERQKLYDVLVAAFGAPIHLSEMQELKPLVKRAYDDIESQQNVNAQLRAAEMAQALDSSGPEKALEHARSALQLAGSNTGDAAKAMRLTEQLQTTLDKRFQHLQSQADPKSKIEAAEIAVLLHDYKARFTTVHDALNCAKELYKEAISLGAAKDRLEVEIEVLTQYHGVLRYAEADVNRHDMARELLKCIQIAFKAPITDPSGAEMHLIEVGSKKFLAKVETAEEGKKSIGIARASFLGKGSGGHVDEISTIGRGKITALKTPRKDIPQAEFEKAIRDIRHESQARNNVHERIANLQLPAVGIEAKAYSAVNLNLYRDIKSAPVQVPGIINRRYTTSADDMIKEKGPVKLSDLSNQERVYGCWQLAYGMNLMQQIQVIHLDQKPGNWLVNKNPDGTLTWAIADWGGAEFFDEIHWDDDFKKKLPDVSPGIISAMEFMEIGSAREAANSEEYLIKCQKHMVFSLGCGLYQILTAKRPFSTMPGLGHLKVGTLDLAPLQARGYTEELIYLIAWMADPDPNKRPQPSDALNYLNQVLSKHFPELMTRLQENGPPTS